jgi:transcriptional regulator with XRE-family HTH domain
MDTEQREGRVVAAVPADTFGHRLMLVRAHCGHIPVREAADRCGLNYGSWSNWERGKMPRDLLEVVEAIAQGLGIDEEWLLRGGPLARPERRTKVTKGGLTLSLGWRGPRNRDDRRPRRLRVGARVGA